jgi:hypothetical protein
MAFVIKLLANGQLPSTIGDIYTTPGATQTIIKSIILVNTAATTETVNLYVLKAAGAARRIIPKDAQLGAGFQMVVDDDITLGAGDKIQGDTTTATTVDFTVSGVTDTAGVIGEIPWVEVAGTSQNALPNNGYITQSGSLTTVTLPTSAVVGTLIAVAGAGVGGWVIAQNAGQSIRVAANVSTPGVTGSLSGAQGVAVEMLCVTADTAWIAVSSIGTVTVT